MEGGTTEIVAVATVFGVVVTKTVDLLRNAFDKEDKFPKWAWNVIAFLLGVGVAVTWEINLLDNWTDESSWAQGAFGRVLTGISIGGVASGYHEVFDVLSSTARKANPRP